METLEVSTTHPPFRERATHPLVRIIVVSSHSLSHCYTLRGDLYPNKNPHLFRVWRVFWSLVSFGNLLKEVGEVW